MRYFDEINQAGDLPWEWHPHDVRQKSWAEQRKQCGFDEREIWSLDHTFALWLYSRIRAYQDWNCINLDCHRFIFRHKTYSQRHAIEYIIDHLKQYFEGEWHNRNDLFDAAEMFITILPTMWW